MPKAIKKKATKKKRLKEEEVRSTASRYLDFIKVKKNLFLYAVLAIIVAALSVIVLLSYSSSLRDEAYALEKEAYDYYFGTNVGSGVTEEERWKKSLDLFQEAMAVKPSPATLYYTGNCYFNLGQYVEAIEMYSAFIDRYGDEEIFIPLVYQKLAAAYFESGAEDEAGKVIDRLAVYKDGIFRDTALVLAARQYEVAGRQDDAMDKYRELIAGFPFSPWMDEARAKVDREEQLEATAEEGFSPAITTEVFDESPATETQASPEETP